MQSMVEDWDNEIANGEVTADNVVSSLGRFNEVTSVGTYGNTKAVDRYERGRETISR